MDNELSPKKLTKKHWSEAVRKAALAKWRRE